MKKYLKVFFILFILIIFYLYIANLTLMPKSITLLQGEKLELAKLWGINLKQKDISNLNFNINENKEILETSSSIGETNINQTRKSRYGC